MHENRFEGDVFVLIDVCNTHTRYRSGVGKPSVTDGIGAAEHPPVTGGVGTLGITLVLRKFGL